MGIRLEALYDVLTYMLEGMYLKDQKPENYRPLIENFHDLVYQDFSLQEREQFFQQLPGALKYCLNNPEVDCNELLYQAALHGLNTQEEARQLFALIWTAFFGNEDWRDERYKRANVRIVDEAAAQSTGVRP